MLCTRRWMCDAYTHFLLKPSVALGQGCQKPWPEYASGWSAGASTLGAPPSPSECQGKARCSQQLPHSFSPAEHPTSPPCRLPSPGVFSSGYKFQMQLQTCCSHQELLPLPVSSLLFIFNRKDIENGLKCAEMGGSLYTPY